MIIPGIRILEILMYYYHLSSIYYIFMGTTVDRVHGCTDALWLTWSAKVIAVTFCLVVSRELNDGRRQSIFLSAY
jgi:hypothetical protein